MSRQPERTLARRSAFLLAARIFPALALLGVMVWYSRVLSPAAYGQYQNIWVRYGLLSTLACMGIPTLAQVVGPADLMVGLRGSSQKMRAFFGVLLGLSTLLFVFWNRGFPSLPVLVVFFIGWVLATLAEGLALGQRRYRQVSVVNGVASLLFVALHGFFAASPPLLFGSLGLLALLRAFVLYLPFAKASRRMADGGVAVAVGLTRLWRDLAVYDLIQQSSRLLDKALVGFLVVPALSGVYFNGAQEVPFLPLLLGAAGSAFLHQAADAGETGATGKAVFIRATGSLLAAFVFPLFWFLMLGREALFEVVFGGRYQASVSIFAMTTLVLPLRAYPFSAMLQHFRKTQWVLWGAAGDLVLASVLAWMLYPLLGLPGIALSFSLSTLCMVVFYTWKTVQITGLSLSALFPLRQWAITFLVSASMLYGVKMVLSFTGLNAFGSLLILALCAAGLTALFGFRNFRKM